MFSSESTPTHLPPPPRVVHGGVGCGIWFLRLFMLPHTAVGIFLIGWFLVTLAVAVAGTDTRATVMKAYTSQGSKGGTVYHLEYTYDAGDRKYSDSGTVGYDTYAAASRPGEIETQTATVRVRYLELGGYHKQIVTEDRSAWAEAGFVLLFALFWNGILSVFVGLAWVMPIRRTRLVKNGETTGGTIVSSRIKTGKNTSYYVKFRFVNPETGQEIEREIDVPGALFQTATPERQITVIYWPGNPKRSLIYELSGYQVEGAQS